MTDRQSSAAVRVLKAKLKLLKRPTVWGAGIILFLPLLFLADYWLNPQQFLGRQLQPEPQFSAELAEEDAPTIGNPENGASDPSSLLEALSATPESGAESLLLQTDLLDALLTAPVPEAKDGSRSVNGSRSVASPKAKNDPAPAPAGLFSTPTLFSSSSSEASGSVALGLPSSTSINPAIGLSGNQAGTTGSSSDASGAVSPLQSALDRSTFSQPARQAVTDSTASPQNNANAATVTNLYGQSTPSTLGQSLGQVTPNAPSRLNYPLYIPQTSPNPGTTGYTIPPALRTPAVSPSTSFTPIAPAIQTQPLPGYRPPTTGTIQAYPMPTYSAPPPQVQSAPFSVQRTPPGQHIGGGQINTFSNP